MKLQGRSEIEALAKFKSQGDFVTSFYLDTDKSRQSKKEIQLTLKNLLNGAKTQLEPLDMAKERKDSLYRDLDLISDYGAQNVSTTHAPGLAVFSCCRRNFWMPLELPHGPRNRVFFDTSFYVRPLDAILDKYSRLCIVLLGRREAKWYEIYLGDIKPLDSLTSDVPGKIKEGGFEGTEAKRIERHAEARLLEHFKKAAQMTFELAKKNPFDWLFVGCEENHHIDFESQLHRYLKEKVKAHVKARVDDSPAKVLKEALELEAGLKKEEEEETVHRLIAELERGGRACSGLRETLNHLNLFEVQSLVVTHNFSKEGRICPTHKYLYVNELQCPVCLKKTDVLPDVIDEAIETALKRNCAVKHITPPSKLDRYGQIGAFLKYKV